MQSYPSLKETQSIVVCGTSIVMSKAETVEERRKEYQHMASVYSRLAQLSYQHPAQCRDDAARAFAYECAAKHTR